jgi:hypothetical protein
MIHLQVYIVSFPIGWQILRIGIGRFPFLSEMLAALGNYPVVQFIDAVLIILPVMAAGHIKLRKEAKTADPPLCDK